MYHPAITYLHCSLATFHVHVATYDNVFASQDVFIAIYITSHVHYAVGSLPLANNAMHSPSIIPTYIYTYNNYTAVRLGWLAAEHAVIRQHAHKIARSASLHVQCTRRKIRLASESAEKEETPDEICRGSETAEARERTDIYQRKRRLDSESAEEKDTRLSSETLSKRYRLYKQRIDNLAISSCNDVPALQKSTFHIELGLHSMPVHVSTTCFILHAAHFILHVHVRTITCLLLRTCL